MYVRLANVAVAAIRGGPAVADAASAGIAGIVVIAAIAGAGGAPTIVGVPFGSADRGFAGVIDAVRTDVSVADVGRPISVGQGGRQQGRDRGHHGRQDDLLQHGNLLVDVY